MDLQAMQKHKINTDYYILYNILLPNDESVTLELHPEKDNSLRLIDAAEAVQNSEAALQLKEGCKYEYKLNKYNLSDDFGIIERSRVAPSAGRISPKNYVGTISIDVVNNNKDIVGQIKLEVQSTKMDYREHYRKMLEEIAEYSTELVMQSKSPLIQKYESFFSGNAETLYQRFAFIKSILDSREFDDGIQKILSSPVSVWSEEECSRDIRNVKRISKSILKQIVSCQHRRVTPINNTLHNILPTVPVFLNIHEKTRSIDTPENRFIKHALNTFLSLCTEINARSLSNIRLQNESQILIEKLEHYLNQAIFKEISNPDILPLNSPILQRKEGYREILRIWLMFDLASKLTWEGGNEIYTGGKRDVALLYEYWVFFRLLRLVQRNFNIDPKNLDQLVEETENGLGIRLKQGKYLPIKGVFVNPNRLLNVELSFNRTFTGSADYPKAGSWTNSFRPDYTLSIWPYGIDCITAEKEELIVHIHFDAKYRIEELSGVFEDNPESPIDINRNPKQNDFIKMHAYRDAIRRTGGAYIIYPGNEQRYFKGFHEVIPGLGAFSLNPGRSDYDCEEIRSFLLKVVEHLLDRATQREKISFRSYQIYKQLPENSVYDYLPELIGINRDLIPDETMILIAWYKNYEHLNWIHSNNYYNARVGDVRGSINVSAKLSSAKFILLHGPKETVTGRIYRLSEKGPRIWSKTDLNNRQYPSKPTQDFYLVFEIQNPVEKEFNYAKWNINSIGQYTSYRGSPLPFVVSLTELMSVKVNDDKDL
jgi:hypothetical protein